MKTITRLFIFTLLILAVIIPSTASASGLKDDKVIFGGNFTLTSGESLDGDLVVFGGNVVLESASTVNGDTVVLGGNITSNGTVNGNLVALGGFVELGNKAQVNGDLTVLGSSYEQAEGAVISGNIITEENVPFEFDWPSRIALFNGRFDPSAFQALPFISTSWFFFKILIWTGLAVLMALFIQDQAAIINKAAFNQPFMSILVGLGIITIAPLVLIALIITIILSPVSILGIFALVAAWAVGLVALSIEVGKKLAESMNQSWPTPIKAGLGMFILALFFNGFSQVVPCVGWMPKFVLGLWVLGAVILTRFGTREYPVPSPVLSPAEEDLSLPEPFAPKAETAKTEVNATKAAIELAKSEGIDISGIKGSGANGKITINDVRKALKG
jgi:pyruvate/2-oxoglutarate dehydrogenase complex dihydrolipoamide acyltransferase (E2) component